VIFSPHRTAIHLAKDTMPRKIVDRIPFLRL
jgi:hypothetical protein